MTGAEALASVFGGLGLFFIAIRAMSAGMQRLAGRRIRSAMAQAGAGPVRAAVTGLAIGVATQSSNAATFVTASLLTAGLLPLAAAFTAVAWANVGPAVLVLLTAIDLRLAALWLLGAIGFAGLLGAGHSPRTKPLLDAVVALCLALLGLSLVKSAGVMLRAADPTTITAALGTHPLLTPFLAGLVVAAVVQSSSTPAILSMKLGEADLLGFDQLAMVVYGASIGSGLALLIVGRSLRGTARQLVLFQALFKSLGPLLLLLAFAVERDGGPPLVLHLARSIGGDRSGSIAILFLIVQLASCALLPLLGRALAALVARWAPPTPAESLGRPAFLTRTALADPTSALDLVARETQRLADRTPILLDHVRDGASPGAPPLPALMQGGAALETEIAAFVEAILAQECPPDVVARGVRLEARLSLLRSLRETLGEFAGLLAAIRNPTVLAIAGPMAESLHFLLMQAIEASSDAEFVLLRDLCSDRGELMEALRRQTPATGLDYAAQDQLFRTTTLFERSVWLTGRLALNGPATAS